MHFQLYSDLHTELIKKRMDFDVMADVLILAGDIGCITTNTFKPFIDNVSKKWKHVVYVPGNHEYYASIPITKLKQAYHEFFLTYDNVHYLDNSVWEYNGYLFVGSTLWSNPSDISGLNDFYYIKETNKLFTPTSNKKKVKPILKLTKNTFCELHKKSVEWIRKIIINNNTNKKIIMITHFPPINENVSHPKYKNEPGKDYFSNNFESLNIPLTNVKLWISGHTHFSYDIMKNNVRFLSNQLGYVDEIQNDSGVDVDGLFSIE